MLPRNPTKTETRNPQKSENVTTKNEATSQFSIERVSFFIQTTNSMQWDLLVAKKVYW